MSLNYTRGATASGEIAHRSLAGTVHGHSLEVQAFTRTAVDLDAWQATIAAATALLSEGLLEDIAGRTFEDVAAFLLDRLPDAYAIKLTLPTLGHTILAERTA